MQFLENAKGAFVARYVTHVHPILYRQWADLRLLIISYQCRWWLQSTNTEKQKVFSKNLALKYYNNYKEEHYSFDLILRDVEAYLLTSQRDQDWRELGNGLPPPSAFK